MSCINERKLKILILFGNSEKNSEMSNMRRDLLLYNENNNVSEVSRVQ